MTGEVWAVVGTLFVAILGQTYYLGGRIDKQGEYLGGRIDAQGDRIDGKIGALTAEVSNLREKVAKLGGLFEGFQTWAKEDPKR